MIVGRERLERWAGGAAVATLVLVFLSSWWNRYLSPMSGFELSAVYLLDNGWLPFRDYFTVVPPGSTLLSVVIARFFGNHLIAYYVFGGALRLVGALVAYIWLCRRVQPAWAAFAVVSAFVLSSVDIADTPYFYNHLASNFALLAAFFLSGVFKGSRPRRALFGLLGGLMLGCTLLIKQTTGVIVTGTLGVAICLFLISKKDWERLFVSLVSVGIGLAIPVLSFLGWVYAKGILPLFLDQVFVRGPSSKGGALVSLLRPFTLTLRSGYLSDAALGALLLTICGWVAYAFTKYEKERPNLYLWLALPMLMIALLMGRSPFFATWDLRMVFLSFSYLSSVGCLSICLWAATGLILKRWKTIDDPDLVLMAAVGFACAFALSISWPAFEAMIFPGAALLLALALEWGGPPKISPVVRAMMVTFLLVLVLVATARKHARPFYWGRWAEPPVEASTTAPKAEALRGFVISPWTANFFDEVTELVRANSTPEDRIYVYPSMPILYGLCERFPATFGMQHWVDVCPDYLAEADAEQLLRSPPAVIVVHPDLPAEIAKEEMLFRDGKRSSVRNILSALGTLYPRYNVIKVFQVPGHPEPIQVWALKR